MNTKRWALIAVLATVLALLMAGPAFAGGHPADPPGLDRANAAKERHIDALLAIEGVFGAGVTQTPDGREAVVVYTKAVGVNVPRNLDGVPVVRKVTGEIVALADPITQNFGTPVPIGTSSGNENGFVRGGAFCTSGTLGFRGKDADGNIFAVSNNHVYARENEATIGEIVEQPGLIDTGCGRDPSNNIGTLVAFVPIVFDRNANNTVDAAIAASSLVQLGNSTPAGLGYGTPSSSIVDAFIGQDVQKVGRTTGHTVGRIDGINVTLIVRYNSGQARFEDQVAVTDTVEDFSAGGDSGSLIVTADANKNPVALLFAGGGSSTFGNRIGNVLSAYGITVDGAAPAPDETAPTLDSAAVDGTSLVLAYDEALDANSVPATGAFSIGTGGQSVTAVAVSGTDVTLTLSPGAAFGDGVTVSYTAANAGGSPIQDAAENEAADLVDRPVTNNTPAPVGGVTVTSVEPNSGNREERLSVTVSGSGFQAEAAVDFGDGIKVQSVTLDTDTQLTVRIRIHKFASPGSRNVTVTNPDGSSGLLENGFTVN